MIHLPTNCQNNMTTLRRERLFSCSQNSSYAALRHAVSVVSVAAASVVNEGLHPLWGSCCRPILPPPSFSVWFHPIHLPFFLPFGFGPPCMPIDLNCLPALSGSGQFIRALHTLSTGAFVQSDLPLNSTGIRKTDYCVHRLHSTIAHQRGARPIAN